MLCVVCVGFVECVGRLWRDAVLCVWDGGASGVCVGTLLCGMLSWLWVTLRWSCVCVVCGSVGGQGLVVIVFCSQCVSYE